MVQKKIVRKKSSENESDEVNKCPGGVVILENSPVGESQSNGMVERAVKEVQHQIRKLKMQIRNKNENIPFFITAKRQVLPLGFRHCIV